MEARSPVRVGDGSRRSRRGGAAPRKRGSDRPGPGRRPRMSPAGRARARTRGAGSRSSRSLLRLGKRVAELGAGSVKARLDRWDGQVEAVPDLLERQVGVVMKEDRQPVRGVQLRESLDE